MAYLNHAGTSWPKPGPVRAAVADALVAPPEVWAERFDRQHRRVARWLGTSPERLLLTPGCTSALAVGVADHPWQPGDRVLTSGFEHLALERPLLQLRDRGVELVIAPPASDGPVDLDAVEAVLRQGRVRLVACSWASNVTGALLPIAELVALAHAHGAQILVDAAQVAGWLDLELPTVGVDLLAFAGHKGPQGPWGVGGLYVAEGVPLATPRSGAPVPGPGWCDVGSVDRAALAGLCAALDWLAAPTHRDRLVRARAHVEGVAAALEALPGVTLRGPRVPEARMPTLAFTVEGRTPQEVGAALAARGITASAGEQCAPLAHRTLGTSGVVRLSAGPTTTEAEVDRAVDGLRDVLAR